MIQTLLKKEFNILKRDIIGLTVLFVMPILLLIVITGIQTTNYKNNVIAPISVILVNNDKNINNDVFVKNSADYRIHFIDKISGKKITEADAKKLLSEGKQEAILIIPPNFSDCVKSYYENLFKLGVILKSNSEMKLLFSPLINPILKESITQGLEKASLKTQLYFLEQAIFKELGDEPPHNFTVNTWLQSEYMTDAAPVDNQQPSPVQQNVPAWALFGMFFIVIPLSAAMIHERKSSVMNRLKTTPMRVYSFLLAKLTAYLIINMLQLLLMFIIGIYILPHMGILPMNINGKIIPIIVIGIFSSLAATGFGLFIGSVMNTHQQASMLGPVLIIIAAAVGGIMVPLFLMPPALQKIATFSPLNWGQSAFIDILVKNTSIFAVFPMLFNLFIFFLVCFCISWLILKKHN